MEKQKIRQRRQKPFRLRKPVPQGYFTVQEVCEYLGISERTVRRYISECGMPSAKISGRRLVNRERLEEWIRQHEE